MRSFEFSTSEKSAVSSWDIKNLSSTWYCVAGSVGGAGLANHEILIGNPSDAESSVLFL